MRGYVAMARPASERRPWGRAVLAVAATVAVVVAGAGVMLRHDRSTVATSSALPIYLLPTWPDGMPVISAQESPPGASTVEPTVHVFQRVNSDPTRATSRSS